MAGTKEILAASLLIGVAHAFQGGILGLQPAQRVLANSPRMGTRAVPAVLMQLAPRSKEGMGHDNAGTKVGGGDGSRAILRVISGAAIAVQAAAPALAEEAAAVAASTEKFVPRGITTEDTAVFVIGCIPFLWATISFWTRIANGQPFGTGKDSVVFETDRKDWEATTGSSQRILTKGAMRIAYLLMAAAGISVAGVFYAASQLPATLTPS